MPPRVNFDREQILSAAVNLLRREGKERFTARNVARELGGSTQPIYRVFSNLKELEEAVFKTAHREAIDFMLKFEDEESYFLSIGMGYLAFARREPNLFDFLFSGGKQVLDSGGEVSPFRPLYKKMRKDPFLRDLPEEDIRTLFRDMFIYTHGLCSFTILNKEELSLEEERRLLQKMGGKLIAVTFMTHKKIIDIDELMRRYHSEGSCP